jgi:acyl carrier protein
VANTQLYLLDPQQRLVPIGVPGELHIGGVQLARGYLNCPELTAEKFIPNPFRPTAALTLGGQPSAVRGRLYRTGDLARYLPDGNLEYLGRIDHQVKIRGFRMELGEIETVLGQHPAVKETVVLAREDVPNEKRLVAYVVPSTQKATLDSDPSPSDLRRFLKEKLPDYMIPSVFILLDALPLMPNGKIDRHALPAPDQSRPDLREVFVAPRTAVEERLAGIWAELLRVERVGIHDNFFELGGHSLLVTQIISRLRDAFQVELPLPRLFELPTIAELAPVIEKAMNNGAELRPSTISPISRVSRRVQISSGGVVAISKDLK